MKPMYQPQSKTKPSTSGIGPRIGQPSSVMEINPAHCTARRSREGNSDNRAFDSILINARLHRSSVEGASWESIPAAISPLLV